jgi:acetyl esterase/lipase
VERYGDHLSQFAQLWLPEAEAQAPAPVAVVVHGGFWREPYDLTLMEPLCLDLAASGWAAWNVEYRRLGGGGGWPATFDDVAAAVDALAELDAGLDLGTVAAIGHSSGGHLALWAGARASLPAGAPGAEPRVRVTHAVAQAPVTDLDEASRLGLSRGAADELLGATPAAAPDRAAVASPFRLVPLGIPQLLVHGGRDANVPVAMSRAYAAAARGAGDAVELHVDHGAGHFEHLDPRSSLWEVARRWLNRLR